MSDHLLDESIAAYLDGRMGVLQRAHIEAHIVGCSVCLHRVTDIATVMAETGLRPETTLEHPLERLLRPLQHLAPFPLWFWNCLAISTTYTIWELVLNQASVPWGQSTLHALAAWLITVCVTSHLLWIQPHLRALLRDLWSEGAPPPLIRKLSDQIAWSQGWSFGGLWFFAILASGISLVSLPTAANDHWEWVKAACSGFYSAIVLAALYWSWLGGGVLCRTIAEFMRDETTQGGLQAARQARPLALISVVVASLSVISQVILESSNLTTTDVLRIWAPFIAVALVILWVGYADLELSFIQRGQHLLRAKLFVASRLLGTLALMMAPLSLAV